jgi:hypothetical protein
MDYNRVFYQVTPGFDFPYFFKLGPVPALDRPAEPGRVSKLCIKLQNKSNNYVCGHVQGIFDFCG